MPYFLAPFIGWFVSGVLKFIINSIRFGSEGARAHAGNGGFPSTHTSTIATVAFLIGFGEGWLSPAFGLAAAFLFIVAIDATGLRIAVGKQAAVLNHAHRDDQHHAPLREKMGHTRFEIAGGLVVGLLTSYVLYQIFLGIGWV